MNSIEALKHFITEDIYIISDKKGNSMPYGTQKEENNIVEEPKVKLPLISGNSMGKVLIITPLPLSESHVQLLTKIMEAVKVDYQELGFLKIQDLPPLSELVVNAEIILLFGEVSGPDVSSMVKYEVLHLENKAILYSESLEILGNSVEDKKKLWTALQGLFLA
ncbi:MAG: hypothetical protein AAF843_18435 [Bacteroidota bacterium]